MAAGNQSFQKQANIALILKTIHDHRSISRVELSRIIGLRKSTVSNIINELIETGIVIQKETGSSGTSGGRKPVYIGINSSAGCILGLEPEKNVCHAVLFDLDGGTIWSKSIKTDEQPFTEMFLSVYRQIEVEIKADNLNLLAVAAGISGSINPEKRVIIESITHKLTLFDYGTEICSQIPVPVFFENDTNCAAWGELKNPENKSRNFLCLLTRFRLPRDKSNSVPGIGLGLVIRGEIFHGADFSEGEFGSNNWFEAGTEYIGMSREQWDSLDSDDDRIISLMTAIFRKLSVSMSLFNPELLVLSGDMKEHSSLLPAILSDLDKDSWFGRTKQRQRIVLSKRDSMEIAGGAADMVLSRLYSIPQLGHEVHDNGISWSKVFKLCCNN